MLQAFSILMLAACQLPSQYAALSTLGLVCVAGLFFLVRRQRIPLSRLQLLLALIGSLCAVFVLQAVVGLGAEWITLAQIATFSIAAALVSADTRNRRLPKFALGILVLNALLALSFFAGPNESLWREHGGGYRLQSYFDEPAEAAVMYSLCLAIILSGKVSARRKAIAIVLYMALIGMAQSLSGVFLASLLMAAAAMRGDLSMYSLGRSNSSTRRRSHAKALSIAALIAVALAAVALGKNLYDQSAILKRVASLNEAGADGSAQLRLLSPLQIAQEIYSNDDLLLGMGIGGHEAYILEHSGDFPLQVIFTGEEVGAVNNGYVVIIAMLGYPLASIVFVVSGLLIAAKIRAAPPGWPKYLLVLMLAVPLVDGRIITPIYFLLAGLLGAGLGDWTRAGRQAKAGARLLQPVVVPVQSA